MRTDVAAILSAAGKPVGTALEVVVANSWNEKADPVADVRAAIAAMKDSKRQAEVNAHNAHWNAMLDLQLIEWLNRRSCTLERADLLVRSGHKPTEADMATAVKAWDEAWDHVNEITDTDRTGETS